LDQEDDWKIKECYEGVVEGMKVAIAYGETERQVGSSRTRITAALVKVRAPRSPNFRFTILQGGWGARKDFTHPDPEFNKHCTVATDHGVAMVALLDSAGFRSLLRMFFDAGGSYATINEYSAFTAILNAEYAKTEGLLSHVRQAAKIMKAFQDRAEKAGYFQKKAA
jgi:hypothetical protein